MEVEIAKKIQRISSWDGLVAEASGFISTKRHLLQVAREREEECRRQKFMENEQYVIRKEQEEQKEQISKLLDSIKVRLAIDLPGPTVLPMSLGLVSLL